MEAAVTATRSGFTLLEVLVVIAVIGILLAIGMPSYQAWITRTELDRAASIVSTEINAARSAARNGAAQTVTLTANGTSIQSRGLTITLPSARSKENVTLVFEPPYGTLQAQAGAVNPVTPQVMTVQSTRDPARTRTLSVVSLMGKVIVQ
nr:MULTISPECIES: type II secretion system protein [unclassified Deinococcus]